MRDGDIDYSRYTLREMEEALAGIDTRAYPKNHANLRAAHERLTSSAPQAAVAVEIGDIASGQSAPHPVENRPYRPNRIPRDERTHYILFSLLLFAYGSYGVWVNDLYLPGKRRGIHLHDVPAWIMYGAMVCACLVMLSVVVDHYDRRNNEAGYKVFADAFKIIGWSLFGLSLVFSLIRQAQA